MECSFLSQQLSFLDILHYCFGHTNLQSIYNLATKDLTKDILVDLSECLPKCDHCIMGKQTHLIVPRICTGDKSTYRLGIVWMDLMRPDAVELASFMHYLINIVNDYSSFSWIFPLYQKSNVLSILQSWTKCIEHQYGENIGIFCIDGEELNSQSTHDWCSANRYILQFIAFHTSVYIG